MQSLCIHPDGHYLMTASGEPFFYLGDTAWDIFQKLTLTEMEEYFAIRARQGFTVLQCVLLNGTEPLDWPNPYGRHAVNPPYTALDYNEDWWQRVEEALKIAEKYGLTLGLVPMWQAKYIDPDHTLFTGYDPAYSYGKFLGTRYRDNANLIWILGGDVEVKPHMEPIFRGLSDGIKAGEGAGHRHLITFHPRGISDTITELGGDRDYLDFLTCQSGHTVGAYEPYRLLEIMRPAGKPMLDAEAHYEEHVTNWLPQLPTWDAFDIRMGAYESILAGACGQTYGNPIVAFFLRDRADLERCPYYVGNLSESALETKNWRTSLECDGANQLHILKNLRLSRPYFDLRPAQELVLNSRDDLLFGRISAARGEDYAYIYTPFGREIEVDASQFSAEILRASWLNPRTGEEKGICCFSPRKALFVPPTQGRGQDWLLILESAEAPWVEVRQPTSQN